MELIFDLILLIAMIYAGLFVYTQLWTVFTLIKTFGYTYKDLGKIMSCLPNWNLRIPFNIGMIDSDLHPDFSLNPEGMFRVKYDWFLLVPVFLLLIIIVAVYLYFKIYSGRRKTKYERESFGHVMSRFERKRGLCRIEYTATKHFNVYGGKGKITRHTPRVFIELILRPLYILENKLADEYNWPQKYRWNLQKGRIPLVDEGIIEGLIRSKQEDE